MKVRFIKQAMFKAGRADMPHGMCPVGLEVDVSAAAAKELIDSGVAEAAKPENTKATKRKIGGKK